MLCNTRTFDGHCVLLQSYVLKSILLIVIVHGIVLQLLVSETLR